MIIKKNHWSEWVKSKVFDHDCRRLTTSTSDGLLEEIGTLTRLEWSRDEPIEVKKNGYIYTRQTDEETGLQQIVRYRIELEEV